jgi:hypothetical protein
VEITRLGDVLGGFTTLDAINLCRAKSFEITRHVLERRVHSGELEKHHVIGVNNTGEFRSDLVLYKIPGTTKIDPERITALLFNRSQPPYRNAKYPLIKGDASTTEYSKFWGVQRYTASKRLHRLADKGIVKQVDYQTQPVTSSRLYRQMKYLVSTIAIWRYDNES